jgi:hypothetical protein
MCTIPRNQSVATGSAFYRLPLSVAQKLHSADHIPNTARLACVMADQNDNIQWETFGLSDFMRPGKSFQSSDPIKYFYSSFFRILRQTKSRIIGYW